MKLWARSKGEGPHEAVGLVIATVWTELEVAADVAALLGSIESIEVSADPKSTPKAAAPVVFDLDEIGSDEKKSKKKKG